MFTLNAYNRHHTDSNNIRKGYACGYSYITRRSKLNGIVEMLFNLFILWNLFAYVYFGGDFEHLNMIPYIQLARNFMVAADNIYQIKTCSNDRFNSLLYTIGDAVTWIAWIVYVWWFIRNPTFFQWALYLRLVIDLSIMARFLFTMNNNGAQNFYQTTGHGIIWSIVYMLVWLRVTGQLKISFFWAMSPLLTYFGFLFLIGVIRIIVSLVTQKLFKKYYTLVFVELNVYVLLLYTCYSFALFIDHKIKDYVSLGIMIIFVMIFQLIFYFTVIIVDKIEQDVIEEMGNSEESSSLMGEDQLSEAELAKSKYEM